MITLGSILVVDDDAEVLESISEMLATLGAEAIREARSGEEALEILRTEKFSVIMADYRLDGMDGVEFLEKVRAAGDSTPVLLVSAAPDEGGVIRAFRQSRVDFFAKPFRMSDLIRALQRLMYA